jgi:hypothetical protein
MAPKQKRCRDCQHHHERENTRVRMYAWRAANPNYQRQYRAMQRPAGWRHGRRRGVLRTGNF